MRKATIVNGEDIRSKTSTRRTEAVGRTKRKINSTVDREESYESSITVKLRQIEKASDKTDFGLKSPVADKALPTNP